MGQNSHQHLLSFKGWGCGPHLLMGSIKFCCSIFGRCNQPQKQSLETWCGRVVTAIFQVRVCCRGNIGTGHPGLCEEPGSLPQEAWLRPKRGKAVVSQTRWGEVASAKGPRRWEKAFMFNKRLEFHQVRELSQLLRQFLKVPSSCMKT